MTTTVFLRCVIDSTEVLPEPDALCKVLAGALIKRTAIMGARVSEMRRTTGEVQGFEQEPPRLTSTVSTVQLATVEHLIRHPGMNGSAELAEAVAAVCAVSEPAGGPHVYDPKSGVAVCLKCGQERPVAKPQFEREIITGPAPVSAVCQSSPDGRHDFSPGNRNQGRVCPHCGAANPEPPTVRKGAFAGDTLMEG